MSSERVFQFDFDLFGRKGTEPAVFIADTNRNREVVNVRDDTGELLAIGESDGSKNGFVIGIKHVSFEFDGRIFLGDARKIASGRVARLAATSALEEGFTFFGAAGEEFCRRICCGNAGRLEGLFSASVEE